MHLSGYIWDAVLIWMVCKLLHYVGQWSQVQMTSHRKGVWKYTSISAERSLHVAWEVFFVISFVDELIELCERCEWTRHSA